jgi:hypothetical protein
VLYPVVATTSKATQHKATSQPQHNTNTTIAVGQFVAVVVVVWVRIFVIESAMITTL